MAAVRVTWDATGQKFAEGTPDDHHYLVKIDGPDGHYEQDNLALNMREHRFGDVAFGSYIASVQNIDVNGAPIGEPMLSTEFMVVDDRVEVLVVANVRGSAMP